MARIGRNTSKRAPSVAVLQFLTAPQFEQLYVRYSEDSPDVLRGLDLHIPSRSKVGVVGKTGGGKVSCHESGFAIIAVRAHQYYGAHRSQL
jgi:ABC-type transport system involved in cytochrome bd biosynthesis fused ATPase/permease subunit